MKRKLHLTTLFLILTILVVACSSESTPVEVTRIVTETNTEQVEVTRMVEGEVITEQVEVTRVVEVEGSAEPEGELIVALSTLPNSIYTPNAAERNASNVAQQMFEGLTWIDEDNNVVGALAESWDISEDGTEYTFYLREGVKFHNGADFTAEDVLTSWEAGKDPANAYAYIHERAESVEVIDTYTVKITTPEPDPLFLVIPARDWAMIPTEYFNEVGLAGIEENPVGTGPFKFVEWVKGERVVLEAFEDYWDEGFPKVASVTFRPIPESSTRLAAIQTGEIHIANRLSSEEAQSLLGVENVQVVRYPVDRVFYIAFNNLTSGIGEPTEDVLVRQAMNYAVDRQAIIDALFDGFADLSTGFMTPENLGYNDAIDPYPYDPEMAQELLEEAGYPDGFEIGFACPIGAYTNFEQVCQAVAGYLEDVGITPEGGEIQFMESGQYWDLEANKELPPLFGDSWSTADGEALNRLIGAVTPDASYAAWSDPTIVDYIDQISVEVDQEARAALYMELHQYMYDNPPFIYLYEPNTFEAINAAVQNYNPRAAENYYLKGVFLALP
jgi:peptide/nickel transport system substrate-binding protein